ncbi:MAG TPA: hypothetical protein VGS14_07425 [Actinomycetes bacterium]|nr:hypothetical protein [Actinomycetes bacterium]
MNLQGAVTIVTSAIGRALVERLADEGARPWSWPTSTGGAWSGWPPGRSGPRAGAPGR